MSASFAKDAAQDFGNGEDEHPVGDIEADVVGDPIGGLKGAALVTTGAVASLKTDHFHRFLHQRRPQALATACLVLLGTLFDYCSSTRFRMIVRKSMTNLLMVPSDLMTISPTSSPIVMVPNRSSRNPFQLPVPGTLPEK